MAEKKNKNIVGCLLIGAAVVVAGIFIIGILAAIAIPSFMRYIKATKVAEAQGQMMMIKSAIQASYPSQCKFPASASSSDIPAGGTKLIPDFSGAGWKSIGFSESAPLYFRYRMVNEGDTLTLIADANFNTNSVEAHTLTQVFTKGPDCTISASQIITSNEFE